MYLLSLAESEREVRSLARLVESLAASRTDHANSEIVRGPFCGGQALVDYSNQRLLDRRSVPIRPHLERFPQRNHADAVQTLELREACPALVWHISSTFPRLVVTWIRRAVGGKSRVVGNTEVGFSPDRLSDKSREIQSVQRVKCRLITYNLRLSFSGFPPFRPARVWPRGSARKQKAS